MKLLNILGAVVVVHIAVLILAVAIPGCRTTTSKTAPTPGLNQGEASMSSPVSVAPELQDSDLNPPLANTSEAAFDPNAAAISNSTSAGRYSPTRPRLSIGSALNPVPLPDATPAVTPVTTYTVKGGDNLWTLAKKNGVSVRELASANDLAPDSGLRVGQVLVVPSTASAVTPAASVAAIDMENVTSYTIRPGDTLAKIARAQGTTVSKLKAFNNLRSDLVRAGDRLAIPEIQTPNPTAVTDASLTASKAPSLPVPKAKGSYQHVVAPGESLTVIAQRYGVKIGDIALANQIRNPALIRPGQSLTIPGWEAPTQVKTPVAAAGQLTPAKGAVVTPVNDDEDLDAGLDDQDLDNVPVITVEEAPITTISTDKDAGPAIFE